jgi:hypothetical protein
LTGKLTPTLERDIDHLAEAQLEDPAEALLDFSSLKDLERWLTRHRSR